jgi:hypothetical protein
MKIQWFYRIFCMMVFLVLTTLSSGVALSAGTPVVSPGVDPDAVNLAVVRYRELITGSEREIYLGVPDLGDGGAHRTEEDLDWDSSNTITFTYDPTLDKLTTNVSNGNGNWTLDYNNFSTNVRDLVFGGDQAVADSALSLLYYLQISTTLREFPPAQLSLDNVYLDGILLGDFPGVFFGTQNWQVSGYDFSAGFTLTGELNLSGIWVPFAEWNLVEISLGFVDSFAPVTTNVVAIPNPVTPAGNVTLTAMIDDSSKGNSNIQSAEYLLGSGTWTPMTAQDGAFDSPTEDVIANFTAPATGGDQTLCVRGTDAVNNTSPQVCINLTVDDQGPLTSSVTATPNPIASSAEVILTAIIDDSTTGGSNIASTQYNLAGGGWLTMGPQDGAFDEPVETATVLLNAPASSGQYSLCVRGTDALTNTGPDTCINLSVDDQGPISSSAAVAPEKVTSGETVTLTATVDDSSTGGSNIQSAEYNLDGGGWSAMNAQDSTFDSPTEPVTAAFSTPGTSGDVNVCVQGTDAAGNTGSQSCTTLTVDNQGPITSAIAAAPNPATPGAQVTLTANVDDPSTGDSDIQSAKYRLDSQPWMAMEAQDSAFDSSLEVVTVQFIAPTQEGKFDLCVHGTDRFGNTGAAVCIELSVASASTETPRIYVPILLRGQTNP